MHDAISVCRKQHDWMKWMNEIFRGEIGAIGGGRKREGKWGGVVEQAIPEPHHLGNRQVKYRLVGGGYKMMPGR